jgi:hypothetical protein
MVSISQVMGSFVRVRKIGRLAGQPVNDIEAQSFISFSGQPKFILKFVIDSYMAAGISDDLKGKVPVNHFPHAIQSSRTSIELACS